MSETRTLREEFGAWLKRTAHTKCSEHACAHCQEVRRLAQLLGGDVNVRGEVFTNEDLIRAGQDWGEGPAERSEPAAASVPLPPAASGGTQEFTAAEVEAEIAAEVIRRHGSHNAAICRMLRAYARLLSPSPAPTGAEGRKE
jgi:hypothetical protein